MSFAENLAALRKQRGISQEELGAQVGVSRQTVSKWELGSTTPELEKLIALGDYFDLSLDELVGRSRAEEHEAGRRMKIVPAEIWHYEFRSKREIRGIPLVHINLCARGLCRAKGLVAIGNVATGLVSIGIVSVGLFSLGVLALGALAVGAAAIGLMSLAAIAVGILAVGAIAVGYFAIGSVSIGGYAVGAAALGGRFAVGESAAGPFPIDMEMLDNMRRIYSAMEESQRNSYLVNLELELIDICPNAPEWVIQMLKIIIFKKIT